jgi:GR25 family glycosyltransferase involved in LPS biosynthesis
MDLVTILVVVLIIVAIFALIRR